MGGGGDTADGSAGPGRQSKPRAWGQLLRLPNLLTVPGDPIAGFMLAGHRADAPLRLIPPAAASLLLYAAGLIHNDLCDLETDRRERPDRPLPSGRVSVGAARLALVVLAAAALGAAATVGRPALATAAGLLAAALLYNRLTKYSRVVGPVNMGLCRGLSLLLGASAVGERGGLTWPVALSALCLTLYIASVTAIAAGETEPREVGLERLLPPLIVLLWMAGIDAMFRFLPIATVWIAAVQILAVQWAARSVYRIPGRAEPAAVQQAVGQLIRVLLPIQAAIVATASQTIYGWLGAWLLLAAWPVAAVLSRRFHAS